LVLGMAWGFHKGFDRGKELLAIYLGCTATGALIGALLARSHILSALAGALSAPITVLHPALGSGMFSAGVELWLRKPTVMDFEALRIDLRELSGWWKNRVSRVLLVFILTNIFTMFGTWATALSFLTKAT
jgi:pheromone shutdown protein TraB